MDFFFNNDNNTLVNNNTKLLRWSIFLNIHYNALVMSWKQALCVEHDTFAESHISHTVATPGAAANQAAQLQNQYLYTRVGQYALLLFNCE